MTNQKLQTVQGYIAALPRVKQSDEIAKVVVITDSGEEFKILHKGVGVDLADHVSASVEVQGVITELEDSKNILVRTYKLNEDWYDD